MNFLEWAKNLISWDDLEDRYVVKVLPKPRGLPKGRISKHSMGRYRATKKYADGRQKAKKNRRPMRKRK